MNRAGTFSLDHDPECSLNTLRLYEHHQSGFSFSTDCP